MCHIVSIYKALKTIPPSSIEAERAFSTCGQFATQPRCRLNDDTLNSLLITNKFYKKEKLLAKEKDLAKQKLSSKPAKAAETTETVEAGFKKDLERPRHLIILRLKCRLIRKIFGLLMPILMSVIAN